MSQIELPDGRVLACGAIAVMGVNLAEAQRHARHGARTRQQVSDLAAAVLFSDAALEGVGAGDRLPGLRRLHH